MSDDVARLLIQVSATTELLRSNLNKAEAAVASFERDTNKRLGKVDNNFSRLGKGIGAIKGSLAGFSASAIGGLISSLSVGAITSAIHNSLEFAGSLGEMAQSLGVGTKFLQEFRFAATQNGASIEEADKAIGKFSITLGKAFSGDKGSVDSIKALGISLDDLKKKTDSERFTTFADAISKIKDPAQRASAAVSIFGKGALAILPTLEQAGDGFRQAAKEAERFGLVLSDKQIQDADKTADKIAELKQALATKIAGVVSDNAEAIGRLANALADLAAQAVNAAAKYLAFRQVSGLFSSGGGSPTEKAAKLFSTRTGRIAAVRRADDVIRSRGAQSLDGSLFSVTTPEQRAKNIALAKRFRAAALRAEFADRIIQRRAEKKPAIDNGEITPVSTGSKKKGRDTSKDAQRAAEAALRDDRQIGRDIFQAQSAELQARLALSTNAAERLAIEHQLLDLETSSRRSDIEEEGKQRALEFPLRKAEIDAQTQKLLLLNDQVDQQKRAKLDADEQIRLVDQENDILSDRLDTYRSIQDVARTAADRAEIEKNILALQQEIERATLEQLIAVGRVTNAEEARANLALRQSAERENSRRRNLGPGGSFLDSLPKTAGEINEALQSIEVEGLRSLNDGITEAIVNGKSLGSVFKSVANSIISDLVRIAVQQAIIKPLAQSLFGGGGSGGGLFSSILNFGATAFGGGGAGVKTTGNILGRASGGPVNAGQPYIVGEKRPELFVPRVSGTIVPSLAGIGGQAVNLTVNAPGATAETVMLIRRELANAAPTIAAAASNMTTRNLSRQRL